MNSTWYDSSYNAGYDPASYLALAAAAGTVAPSRTEVRGGYEPPIIYVAPTSFARPTDANMHLGVMRYDPEYIRENMPEFHTIEPPMPIGPLVNPELRERLERAYETVVTLQRKNNSEMAERVATAAVEDMELRRLAQRETLQGIYGEYNERLKTKRIQESIQREHLKDRVNRKQIAERIQRRRIANGGRPVHIQADGEFYDNAQMFTDEHGLHVMVHNPDERGLHVMV